MGEIFDESLSIGIEILTHGTNQERLLPQKSKTVTNIGRTSSMLLPHGIHEETHADSIQLIRYKMIREFSGE